MTTIPDAVHTAVRAALPNDVAVYDVQPLEVVPGEKYAVVIPDNGLFQRGRYSNAADEQGTFRWSVMSVGANQGQASWVARRSTRHLLTNRIVADGWKCSTATHEGTRGPTRDDAVTEFPVVYCIDQFSMQAFRTA